MPFTISPGVVTKEIDLTTIVPEMSMTEGAIAGPFKWGPALAIKTVSNESEITKVNLVNQTPQHTKHILLLQVISHMPEILK